MALKLITPPATTPVTLVEAKKHLRVDFTDDDALITAAISAATDYAEQFMGRALIDQTWDLILDAFPNSFSSFAFNWWTGTPTVGDSGLIKIPKPPLIEVSSVNYFNTGGVETVFDPGSYYVDNANQPGWIALQGGAAWPTTLNAINAVRIRFRAGYLDTTQSPPVANVPTSIKQALLLTIGAFYESREQVAPDAVKILPWGADQLFRNYRIEKALA